MTPQFAQLAACHPLRPIDVQIARLLARLDQGLCPELPVVAALASWATGQGHTCLPLSALSSLVAEMPDQHLWRDPAALRHRLLTSPVVGRPGEVRPLILDKRDNLFLLRLHRDEDIIAQALRMRATVRETVNPEVARPLLDELFPGAAGSTEVDWQRAAAALALHKRLVILSGGPGTGKTYTAARMLALLIARAAMPPRIALAAPTGKAALRLQESIRQAKTALPAHLAKPIPEQAQTLHRLLGSQANQPGFRHHAANPLHLDLLILDEASMIDVPLMAALLAALPPACRLILLGDRDQLASVEAGNLYADLCGEGPLRWSVELNAQVQALTGGGWVDLATNVNGDPLADCLVQLNVSHRFQPGSGIAALARAVNAGSATEMAAVLRGEYPDLRIEDAAGPARTSWLRGEIKRFFLPLFAAGSAQAALAELGHRRILCALREGPSGVEGINRLAEGVLRHAGSIPPGARFYAGMPLIIQRNDYALGLFNGDTGVLWPDEKGDLQAWFPQDDGTVRPVGLARLPSWQASYAITVHKSQGSEFAEVLLILPEDDGPLLSRELLYTGLTRARQRLGLLCRRDLLLRASQRRVVRYSGLADKLRPDKADLCRPQPEAGSV